MKVAKGLHILELNSDSMGSSGVMRPTLIMDDTNVILVDAGLPGQFDYIVKEMKKTGVIFEKLNKVIITHHDRDHIGSLADIVKKNSKVEVMAHEKEKPYIEGDKRPIKMTPERIAKMEAQLKELPEEERDRMKALFANLSTPVDTLLENGQQLDVCGGITIIHTPGHTPGHICLYLNQYKVLVTGDALNVIDGVLVGPKPEFTYDLDQALNSLKKLTDFDIRKVICYHGGLYTENVNQRIKELAEGELN